MRSLSALRFFLSSFSNVSAVQMAQWVMWVGAMESHAITDTGLRLSRPERRWEVVSSYQKSVRRANLHHALRAVDALCSQPDLIEYMWRRILTTVAEDVGPANNLLLAFVMAAYDTYGKKPMLPEEHRQMMQYLTTLMCEGYSRSRHYCSLSIIADVLKKGVDYACIPEHRQNILRIQFSTPDPDPTTLAAWIKKKGWLTEYLAIYSHYPSESLVISHDPAPKEQVAILKGLPEYAYDMHTRVGKAAIRGVCSQYVPLKSWLTSCTATEPYRAVGYALFYMEGGLIHNELYMPGVPEAEHVMALAQFGLTEAQSGSLLFLVGSDPFKEKLRMARMNLLETAYGQ